MHSNNIYASNYEFNMAVESAPQYKCKNVKIYKYKM